MRTREVSVSGLRAKWRGYIRGLIAMLAAAFMVWALYANWKKLPEQSLALDPVWMCLAIIGVLAVILLQAASWSWMLQLLGQRIGWERGIHLWILSQAAKYVPGSIWNWVARVYLSSRKGINARIATLSIVLENIFLVVACFLIVGVLGIPAQWFTILRWPLLGFALTVELLFILRPNLLTQIAAIGQDLPSDMLLRIRGRDVLMVSLVYLVNMLCGGLVWCLFIRACYPISINALPGILGSVVFAFIAGYLVVIMPQGWGVREGVLGLLLVSYVPPPVAVVIAVLSRAWIILGEIVVFGIVVLLGYLRSTVRGKRPAKCDSTTRGKT